MDRDFIALIEDSEVQAWKNMYDLAPPPFREKMQMSYREIGGGLVLLLDAMPLAHFNMAIGLGTRAPLTKEVVDEIMQLYCRKKPRSFMILQFGQMEPTGCGTFMEQHGLEVVNGWERIYRDASPLTYAVPNPGNLVVKPVANDDMHQWAAYICDAYHLPFHDWLLAMVGAAGWHHYAAWDGDKIVAVRSFYLTPEGWVWSGVEAPVPGIMTTNYQPDFIIWQHVIPDLLAKGAQHFVADIEKITPTQDLESYYVFRNVFGFSIPYTRVHYTRNTSAV